MSYLHECLIYHKFGDCAPAILEYLADYQLALHKLLFFPVLRELIRVTDHITVGMLYYRNPQPPIYDYCNRDGFEWKYSKKRGRVWKLKLIKLFSINPL